MPSSTALRIPTRPSYEMNQYIELKEPDRVASRVSSKICVSSPAAPVTALSAIGSKIFGEALPIWNTEA